MKLNEITKTTKSNQHAILTRWQAIRAGRYSHSAKLILIQGTLFQLIEPKLTRAFGHCKNKKMQQKQYYTRATSSHINIKNV